MAGREGLVDTAVKTSRSGEDSDVCLSKDGEHLEIMTVLCHVFLRRMMRTE